MRTSSSLLLLGTALIAGASSAQALVSVGSDATLFGTLDTSIQYNDNLFLSSPKADNTLFEAAPGIMVQFGQNSLLKGQAYYNEDFQVYSNDTNLNTSLSRLGLSAVYNDDKSKATIDASLQQADQATRDIRTKGFLVHRDLTNASVTDEYLATEKTSVSAGVSYNNTDYKKAGYVDYQTVSVPVKYYYKFEPKLDVSAGYRYRKNNLQSPGIDSAENFYNIGVRGELTPKLTGEISTGYNEFKPVNGKRESGLGLEASLIYAYSPKTSISFGATDGFSYSADGSSNRTTGANLGVNAALASNWSASGVIAYTGFSYLGSTRRDDFYTGQLSATYSVNEYISIMGAYAYSKNNSSLAGATFTDNIFSISAAFKY